MLGIVSVLTNTPLEPGRTRYPWSQALWLVAASIVMLKAIVSRLHDIGRSGWAVLLMFVPLVNFVALLLLTVVPGQKSATRTASLQFFFDACEGLEVPNPIKEVTRKVRSRTQVTGNATNQMR